MIGKKIHDFGGKRAFSPLEEKFVDQYVVIGAYPVAAMGLGRPAALSSRWSGLAVLTLSCHAL
jgi:hypothetical protein